MLVDALRIAKDSPLIFTEPVTLPAAAPPPPRMQWAAAQLRLGACAEALRRATSSMTVAVADTAPFFRDLAALQSTWHVRRAGTAIVVDFSMASCSDTFEAAHAAAVVVPAAKHLMDDRHAHPQPVMTLTVPARWRWRCRSRRGTAV